MASRSRLSATARRAQLVAAAAHAFAESRYDDVRMDEVAVAAGVSRALLYRHFPTKRDLFAAVYQDAADRLLSEATLTPDRPFLEQLRAGLDVHLDYFLGNRNAVLAANRTLAGDPVIQAIINDELATLRDRLLSVSGDDDHRVVRSAILMSWLVFVRTLCVEWLVHPVVGRDEIREACAGALLGALAALDPYQ